MHFAMIYLVVWSTQYSNTTCKDEDGAVYAALNEMEWNKVS